MNREGIFALAGAVTLLACGGGDRYLETVRPIPTRSHIALPRLASEDLRQALHNSAESARQTPQAANVHEVVALVQFDKVLFTAVLDGQVVQMLEGIPQGHTPTLTVEIDERIAKNLEAALADHRLDEQELHNFAYVLLAPCLRRLFAMPYLYEIKKIERARLDDHVHFEIAAPAGWTYHGVPTSIGATVLNVDGEFHVQPGLRGDPDVLHRLTLDQALELYRLMVYEAVKDLDASQRSSNVARVRDILNDTRAYEREWH